ASDHVAGHRLGDETVPEWLHGEGLAVGALADRLSTGRGVVDPEIRPDPARVHERELGAPESSGLCGNELGVGDHVAQSLLALRVDTRSASEQVALNPPDHFIRQWGRRRHVLIPYG